MSVDEQLQRKNFRVQAHKSLGFCASIPEDAYDCLSGIYGLPAQVLREEAERCAQLTEQAAAALLRGQPLRKELWREPCTISILGDSISSYQASFWRMLKRALRGCPVRFCDHSISGQTSGELFITMYPSIFQSHADLAHLMIGTNDCRRTVDAPHALHTGLEEFEKNVRFLLASLQSGGTRSVVSSIPPVDQQKIDAVFPEYRLEYFEPDRQAFNGVLRRAAEDFGAVFNDMEPVYAAFSPAELTIEDGVHLNGHAHGLLAARVWALFQSIRTEQTAG